MQQEAQPDEMVVLGAGGELGVIESSSYQIPVGSLVYVPPCHKHGNLCVPMAVSL